MLYRKLPVTVQAWQIPFTDEMTRPIPQFIVEAHHEDKLERLDDGKVRVKTAEGSMIGNMGDWIIKGIKGELYPCRMDIFEATYEKVEI